MAHIHRKYIDSHWLIFAVKGLLALFFGWLALFNSGSDLNLTISVIAMFLLCFSVIEFVNSLHRAHMRTGWGVSVLIALVDAGVGIALLLTLNANMAVPLITLACYTTLRGLCEIIIAFRTTVDPTDRFIWLLSGVCGAIMGIVILNSGHLAQADFVRFFGAYALIIGITNLIYSIHNHFQKVEDRVARSEAARNRGAKASTKKTTKKSSSKSTRKKSTKKGKK